MSLFQGRTSIIKLYFVVCLKRLKINYSEQFYWMGGCSLGFYREILQFYRSCVLVSFDGFHHTWGCLKISVSTRNLRLNIELTALVDIDIFAVISLWIMTISFTIVRLVLRLNGIFIMVFSITSIIRTNVCTCQSILGQDNCDPGLDVIVIIMQNVPIDTGIFPIMSERWRVRHGQYFIDSISSHKLDYQ